MREVKVVFRGLIEMKKLVAGLLVCLLCVCLPCAAFAEETEIAVELAPYLGKPCGELAEAVGGFQRVNWPEFANAYAGSMMAQVSVERGKLTGWPAETVYEIFLMDGDHTLDGYRVGDSVSDAKARALQEGWTLTSEEDTYELNVYFAKAADGVEYTLELNADNSKTAIEYITMWAINSAGMEDALNEVAELEAANPNALGSCDGSFTFRNGITWDYTLEDIMALESLDPEYLYDEGIYREVSGPDDTGLWYNPSLWYKAFMGDTVNWIEYNYYFGVIGDGDDQVAYVVNLLNKAYGPSGEPDMEKLSQLDAVISMDSIRSQLGWWSFEDGTHILAVLTTSGDVKILYCNEEFITLLDEYVAANSEEE